MKCKICGNGTNNIFNELVLNKYQVDFYKCFNCGFIQTEKPYWLEESYGSAITDLDVGLVSRNINFSNLVEKIIKNNFDYKKQFLDYAGGYGLIVRLMRDKGFDFYRQDKYCDNIFAQNFDASESGISSKFELLTAFELFEHLENPIEEIEKMLEYSDSILFSTELQPKKEIKNSEDWWYFTPETGQHVAFYCEKTLKFVAEQLGLNFYTDGENIHLFSKRKFEKNPITNISGNEIEIKSLISDDFILAKKIIDKMVEFKKEKSKTGMLNEEEIAKKLAVLSVKLDENINELYLAKNELKLTSEKLDLANLELETKKNELHLIHSSREWKMMMKLQKIVKKIIPAGSLRRKMAVYAWRIVKRAMKFFFKIKRGISGSILFLKQYSLRFKPRKKRKINKNSKKLVYVGHSYHNKTKSTAFLIEFLKEFYEVEVILDESWNGGIFPDLSHIDNRYLGVIFFQNLPSDDILKKIKNDNIIFFPMYDGVPHDFSFWGKHYGLKVVNFSKTLHEKLVKWGLETINVQYFPELQEFKPGNKGEVFFWQRLTRIDINVVSKLLGDFCAKIHIHKAIDPNQKFKQPDTEQEKKYQITYSDWYETRKEMWNVIEQKGIYIAPREFEGIGQSFLEAMAMGKAVVAVNNPTMNEYIEHGKNGYLFDLNNPKEIDFSDIEQVQKNTYEFMKKGLEKWENSKRGIIDFIEKE